LFFFFFYNSQNTYWKFKIILFRHKPPKLVYSIKHKQSMEIINNYISGAYLDPLKIRAIWHAFVFHLMLTTVIITFDRRLNTMWQARVQDFFKGAGFSNILLNIMYFIIYSILIMIYKNKYDGRWPPPPCARACHVYLEDKELYRPVDDCCSRVTCRLQIFVAIGSQKWIPLFYLFRTVLY